MKKSLTQAQSFTPADVSHIARLANIPVTDAEKQKLAIGFTQTMKVVDDIFAADVAGVEPTHQVTDSQNVWREDVVDSGRMLSQDQALLNAKQTHNGYFVVGRVLDGS